MTLQELQQQAHALAREKGWWDHARDPDEVFANFHAEISEAWEEYRSGRPITRIYLDRSQEVPFADGEDLDYFQWGYVIEEAGRGFKPTGFFVELADLVIRIADAAQAWGMTLTEHTDNVTDTTVTRLVYYLHGWVHDAWDAWDAWQRFGDSVGNPLGKAAGACFAFAQQHGVDLWAVISLKMAYNATREKRHGKIT